MDEVEGWCPGLESPWSPETGYGIWSEPLNSLSLRLPIGETKEQGPHAPWEGEMRQGLRQGAARCPRCHLLGA